MIRQTIFLGLFFLYSAGLAQLEDNYTPLNTYSGKTKSILDVLEERHMIQYKRMWKESSIVLEKFDQMTYDLKLAVRRKNFLYDSVVEGFINRTYQKLLDNNSFSCTPGNILVFQSPIINALCYGQGTLIVNIGLLGRLDSESELAFVLAHELAHYELDHVRLKLIETINSRLIVKETRVVKQVLKGKVSIAELEEIRDLIYADSRYSRAREVEADSLGYQYYRNAGFDLAGALSLLDKLDSAEQVSPSIGMRLFKPLDAPNYAFQEVWAHERPSIYGQDLPDSYLFVKDSAISHPEISMRKEKLRKYVHLDARAKAGTGLMSQQEAEEVFRISEFESVKSSFRHQMYDRCIYYALKLKSYYPKNRYLTTMIGRVFLDLLLVRDINSFDQYVPRKTIDYGEDLLRVNNLLNNLSYFELGEVTFNFLNSKLNFDPDEEEHYYLLWKACGLTGRSRVQENVKQAYNERFNKGKYRSKMKDHLLYETYAIGFPEK